jgi:phosphotransferase system  glucose/maltose/N-acetylglucosamine-specific IIC component
MLTTEFLAGLTIGIFLGPYVGTIVIVVQEMWHKAKERGRD